MSCVKVISGISLGIHWECWYMQFLLALSAMLLHFLPRGECWATGSLLVSWIQQWSEGCSLFCLSFRHAFWATARIKTGLWNIKKIFPYRTTLVTSVCRISVAISPVTLPPVFFWAIQTPRQEFKTCILILHYLEKAKYIKTVNCILAERRWS